MTAANFQACLAVVLQSEGGFTDTLQDGSIATNLGVTLHTWSGWIGHAATIAEIEALTPADVAPLYQADYFNASHCPELPTGVDLMVFDAAVNSGIGRAIRTLQEALGVTADGLFGPVTIEAAKTADAASVVQKMAVAREAFYRSLPTFGRFGNGWLARVNRTEAAALEMIAA